VYICSGHVESPKRIKRIFSRFRESGLISRCKLLPVFCLWYWHSSSQSICYCCSSSLSLFGMHHQCIAPLAANSPHSGLSRAISTASSKVRLCRDRSFFRVAIQEELGRPPGLLQSLWGTAVRILLASADSSILITCPNSMSLLFCMIEVRRICSVAVVSHELH